MKMTRSEVAAALKDAAVSYFLRKRYSCFLELGLNSWGKLRGDVVCVNLKQDLVILEVKSCLADFKADTKWEQYLQYCNRMYFVAPKKTALRIQALIGKAPCGILYLDPETGYLTALKSAKKRTLSSEVSNKLILRMAWRNGISRRTRRRVRHFLE